MGTAGPGRGATIGAGAKATALPLLGHWPPRDSFPAPGMVSLFVSRAAYWGPVSGFSTLPTPHLPRP